MDQAGVAKAAVVQASTAYGHDSSYLADSIARFPSRFTGVFSLDPLQPDALKQMDHWKSRGMTGMRVFTTGSTMPGQQTWLDDERAFPVWEKAGKERLPIAVQMTADGIPLLLKIVSRFPETLFLLDHLARPAITDGPPYAKAKSLFDLAIVSQHLSQAHEPHGRALPERAGNARHLHAEAGAGFRRGAHHVGIEFSCSRRHAAQYSERDAARPERA